MPYWVLTFFLGIGVLLFCPKLPNLYWLLFFIPIILLWFITSHNIRKIFFQILIFFIGFSWALIYANWVTSWDLNKDLEGKKLLITGYIASLPMNKKRSINFEFQTESIANKQVNTKLKLNWFGDFYKLNIGDKWQFMVRLKRPHGLLNPGGFDAEKHFIIRHIRATGYVVNSEYNRMLSANLYHYPLTRLRQYLINKIEEVLANEQLTPIIIAFITGAEDKILTSQWQIMRDTGTSYLVAISGLHIGLVASLVLMLVQFCWKLSYRLPLIIAAPKAGVIVGLVVGFIYSAISGFSIPTQRALVMLMMFSLVVLLQRYNKSWNAWLWSLFLVLVINPLSVLTMGFWLSFSAVAAIIYVSSNRMRQNISFFVKFSRMQLAVTLILLPFSLLFFQQFSYATMIANLVAMPGVCLVVVPLSLLGPCCKPNF